MYLAYSLLLSLGLLLFSLAAARTWPFGLGQIVDVDIHRLRRAGIVRVHEDDDALIGRRGTEDSQIRSAGSEHY